MGCETGMRLKRRPPPAPAPAPAPFKLRHVWYRGALGRNPKTLVVLRGQAPGGLRHGSWGPRVAGRAGVGAPEVDKGGRGAGIFVEGPLVHSGHSTMNERHAPQPGLFNARRVLTQISLGGDITSDYLELISRCWFGSLQTTGSC